MNRQSTRNSWLVILFGLLLVLGLSVMPIAAQEEKKEHPEHPEDAEKKEHPEHPDEAEKKEHPEHPDEAEKKEHPEHPEHAGAPPTIEECAQFLERHVADATAKSDGWMTIHDEESGEDREFRLDKIHRERLAKTDEHTYFVCADFQTRDGKVFDLDFWVQQTEDGLRVTETLIHKQEGKPRYTWYQAEDGTWKRKPA